MMDRLVPKLVTVFQEGYDLSRLKADALSGLTVAIVALPLSMAIAIASGVTPDRGLFTAIVGGFLVSLLGGSRHQIGGPAGAFIVLVSATVAREGLDGLLIATALSGLFLIAAGLLRLGRFIRLIPYPVTVGFTAGIAVIIFASQIRDLTGIRIEGGEPGPVIEKLMALSRGIATLNPAALLLSLTTIAVILVIRRFRPAWPALLIAVALMAVLTQLMALPVDTISSKFGGIPRTLPMPAVPAFTMEKVVAVLPDAIAFTLLGAIESLLSAVVADSMTGRRHRSSMELIAQGVANIGSALFGGICVTGTIARTATNVRSGATSPVSGMLHAAFLLAFMLIAAPLAGYIPLASLAGVLAVVAWNMVEKPAFAALLRSSRADAIVLLVTFLLVVFRDLTEGIVVGLAVSAILFIDRMSKTLKVEERPGQADETENPVEGAASDTLVYRIEGVLFFGAAPQAGPLLDRIANGYRQVVLDCQGVPFMDSTAANLIEGAVRKAARTGTRVYVSGASAAVRETLEHHEVHEPRVVFSPSLELALDEIARAREGDAQSRAAGESPA
ncbi:SulP family inorganic anion transporter [Gellertiella hungarica]|uniref:SulP family sulfate permease n=1 Tax=Gellertiella hungarica TaxID=1572859 RepID=A0A7W6J4H8_9HYPH|nr:SulP family inorganic anion transporter [Gellertiella hungarica]MBB4064617.1 SulP family sulfate permease [Gellertiella hungarica]